MAEHRRSRTGLVRPYMVTGGRTRTSDPSLALEDLVVATGHRPVAVLEPEHHLLLDLCTEPASVVDLSSDLTLPVGVIRILVDDLSHDGSLEVCRQSRDPDADLVRRLIARVRSI